ncbi:MAG: hypothetical protein WCG27_08355 [Pseudomonadota bacterium]
MSSPVARVQNTQNFQVSASTVEELAYGLAGGLGTKQLKMGDFYLVDSALVADGTTPHYTNGPVISSGRHLKEKILELSKSTDLEKICPVQAITGDAIYQENDDFLNSAKAKGCDIVNLDSSHLFAVSIFNNEGEKIETIECGVISDVTDGKGHDWDSNLSVMLSSNDTKNLNPLELTGKIVKFYVERLAQELLSRKG